MALEASTGHEVVTSGLLNDDHSLGPAPCVFKMSASCGLSGPKCQALCIQSKGSQENNLDHYARSKALRGGLGPIIVMRPADECVADNTQNLGSPLVREAVSPDIYFSTITLADMTVVMDSMQNF